jgi:hypothetical protein
VTGWESWLGSDHDSPTDGYIECTRQDRRMDRIYGEEGPAMRQGTRKRFRAEARVPLVLPTRAKQVWTMDFTRDS